MSISDISVKERLKIVSKTSYDDIKNYLERKGEIFKSRWEIVDEMWNKFRKNIIKREDIEKHIKDIYFNDSNPVMKYLLPISLYRGDEDMEVYYQHSYFLY